jgi:hypothetical protein
MTAMNWEMYESHVLLLCDTLAIGDDRRPAFMTTKVFFWPHLGACVAGTGAQPMGQNFYGRVNARMVVRDVLHLDQYAPNVLNELWAELLAENDAPPGATSTIYTFGWSQAEARFIGFAYRSTAGFASERLGYGLAIKPAPDDETVFDDITDLESFVGLVHDQKAQDRARPRLERVGIGGEVVMTLLTRDEAGHVGAQQKIVSRFDDHEDDWQILLSKLPENAGHPLSKLLLALDP